MYDWPVPVPDGPLTKPLARLIDLVAASPTFVARAGGADAAELIEGTGGTQRIYFPEVDLDALDVFPAAILEIGDLEFDQDAGGDRNYLAASGVVSLLLVDKGQYEDDLQRSCRDFLNFAGKTFYEISQMFAVSDNLAGHGMSGFWGPRRDALPTDDGVIDRWMAGVEVHWGG